MSILAINGGESVRKNLFPNQINIGKEETEAVNKVLESKSLSAFRGTWRHEAPGFWGGEQVQAVEKEWSEYFNTQHSISVNSCTSALQIACGAAGIGPGDEVIVSPWSMCCSATAPMIWNGTPIFADLDPENFCLSPKSVKNKITKRTKAIIYVDLFGTVGRIQEIMAIAKEHNLIVIEDAAQAIGSKYEDQWAGTIGDIGCFSFTQGKHLTCGEGGMIITDNLDLAMRCRLIKNHAEAVIDDMGKGDITKYAKILKYNMLGFNMRMTEIQAAIIREQLKKLKGFVETRRDIAYYLNEKLSEIPPIKLPTYPYECTNSFYVQPFIWDTKKAEGVSRNNYIVAVSAELTGEIGRPDRKMLTCGYVAPLYRMPLFQNKRLYKKTISPFIPDLEYAACNHPKVEKLWREEIFISLLPNLPLNKTDLEDIVEAFVKVWEYRDEISGN